MEQMTRHPVHDVQHDILERLCRDAEKLLARAPDLSSALEVRRRFCERLDRECVSSVIGSGARAFLDGLIASRWSEHGVNRSHDQH
jgi:hypothetical protein